MLDNELNKDRRTQNLLSDAGSKYGEDQEDRMSYLQSEYGGISNFGQENTHIGIYD